MEKAESFKKWEQLISRSNLCKSKGLFLKLHLHHHRGRPVTFAFSPCPPLPATVLSEEQLPPACRLSSSLFKQQSWGLWSEIPAIYREILLLS